MGAYLKLHYDPKSHLSLNGATYIVAPIVSGSGNGPFLLCHDCATLPELERVIDDFHRDLDEIRKKAKRHFARLDARRATRSASRIWMWSTLVGGLFGRCFEHYCTN